MENALDYILYCRHCLMQARNEVLTMCGNEVGVKLEKIEDSVKLFNETTSLVIHSAQQICALVITDVKDHYPEFHSLQESGEIANADEFSVMACQMIDGMLESTNHLEYSIFSD